MTNAGKYLKEGINKEELFSGIAKAFFGECSECDIARLNNFFYEELQPNLTEDERVILRNMTKPNIKAIGRSASALYLQDNAGEKNFFMNYMYRDLFQFIKEGEEYEIAELLKGE